uniref:TIL domain-containing protein n=1 Tax=Anopheles dirus TaxID=7168 RepID=A0A182N7E7_9DIPT
EFTCNRVNEIYDECGNGCGDLTCQNYRRGDVQCGRECREGCFCKGGHVRTRSGICVPTSISHTPFDTLAGESQPNHTMMKIEMARLSAIVLFVICALLTVQTSGQAVQDPQPEPIFCKDPNEVYDDCGPICGDRTCANQRKNDVSCLRACQAGCFCKGGYVRNKSRTCVPSYLCTTMG